MAVGIIGIRGEPIRQRKSWFCDICENSKDYKQNGKTMHLRSKMHREKLFKRALEIAGPIVAIISKKPESERVEIANMINEIYGKPPKKVVC